MLQIIISIVILILWIFILLAFTYTSKVPFLAKLEQELENISYSPVVSILVPACNEAAKIKAAVESLLLQDYPYFEVIVINDRSTDETGQILAELNRKYKQLKVIHIETLPQGWLGKNHALYIGVKESSGDWILFTDADVIHAPNTLKYAIRYCFLKGLDHLPLAPNLLGRTIPVRIFNLYFFVTAGVISLMKKYTGVGAFNLFRRSAYEAVGTMAKIPLRPDDDLKLGKLFYDSGFKQDFVSGRGLIEVEWYPSLKQAIRGLDKNYFATMDYKLTRLAFLTALILIGQIYPFVAIWFVGTTAKVILASSLLICFLTYFISTKFFEGSPLYFFAHPVTSCLNLFIAYRCCLKAFFTGYVEWRGTKYPVELLKQNKV